MPIKRYKPEQIVTVLRQIEVELANGRRLRKPAKRRRFPCRATTAGGRNTVA